MLFRIPRKRTTVYWIIIFSSTFFSMYCMFSKRIPENSLKEERYLHRYFDIKKFDKSAMNISSSRNSDNNISKNSNDVNKKNNNININSDKNNGENSSGAMVETLRNKFIDLDVIVASLLKPWTKNYTNVVNLRKNMYGKNYNQTTLTESIFVSKQRIQTNETNLPKGIQALLPEKSPFNKRFSSCSVVGSSGILVNSSCGKAIDKSEFVFRFNLSPTENFINDVGGKCNLTTFNPSIVIARYRRLNNHSSHVQLVNNLLHFNESYIWFPLYNQFPFIRKAVNVVNKDERLAGRSLFGSSKHNKVVKKFWKMKRLISSGFYMVNTALAMCDDVTLYGFWPFYADRHHRILQYHYYEPQKLSKLAHSFGDEFRILVDLHNQGVLKLIVDSCI